MPKTHPQPHDPVDDRNDRRRSNVEIDLELCEGGEKTKG